MSIKTEKKTAIMVTHDIAEAISVSEKVIVLTKRPSNVKAEISINFESKDLTPFQKRRSPQFSEYFNRLWKELNEGNE